MKISRKQQKILDVQRKQYNLLMNGENYLKECNILWLAYQQGQIFEISRINENFIDMVNKFEISKSSMAFKISINKNKTKKSDSCM